MEVVKITPGITFGSARELPNSTVRPQAKHLSMKSSGNGVKKPNNKINIPGKLRMELQQIDREITESSKMILCLVNGKRKFIRASEYNQFRARMS